MTKLTMEERRFLEALNRDGTRTGRWRLPLATREQDRARTRVKKGGWAVFDRVTWTWRITDAGRAALNESAPDRVTPK